MLKAFVSFIARGIRHKPSAILAVLQPRLPGSSPATSETMIAIILNLCSPLLVRLEMVMVTVQLGCCDTRRLERYVWLTCSVWCASRSLSPHLQPEVQLAFGRGMEAGWFGQDPGCRGHGCWAHGLATMRDIFPLSPGNTDAHVLV